MEENSKNPRKVSNMEELDKWLDDAIKVLDELEKSGQKIVIKFTAEDIENSRKAREETKRNRRVPAHFWHVSYGPNDGSRSFNEKR